ncbi:hypothetical protein WMO32_11785 [Xanthomonas oryzae pv. oryzicola]|uniref:hypothetical protein n=1 Tax=Xanthomonas oryzae TaxID=347 RepID=UPI00313315AC
MKLYENVVIGNFLFGLGCGIGGRLQSELLPASVNLLQQTPQDKLLGDVLLSFPGTLRLIEFKARGSSLKKERAKHRRLSLAMTARPGMLDVSRQVHWYVETAPSEVLGIKALFQPYLEAFAVDAMRHGAVLEFERFIAKTVDEVLAHRHMEVPEQVRDYLALLRWCHGDGKNGAGALMIVVGASGAIHYVELKDMTELRMEHRHWLEYQQELVLELALERKRELALELAHEKRLDRKSQNQDIGYPR